MIAALTGGIPIIHRAYYYYCSVLHRIGLWVVAPPPRDPRYLRRMRKLPAVLLVLERAFIAWLAAGLSAWALSQDVDLALVAGIPPATAILHAWVSALVGTPGEPSFVDLKSLYEHPGEP